MSSTDTPAPSSSTSATTTPTASTPSPSNSSSTAPASQSSSRRPARKSTLTQQQKNQKRQRATQDQLVTLELEFNKNPTPTAAVRERIAQEINMTERSVQIWFQNRRAKIKMIAKKSIETGEDCDSIPESMRQYLAMQFDPNKPGTRDLFGRTSGLGGYGTAGAYNGESAHSGKIVIHHFTCRSLSIGSWRRVGQNAMDLVIFYSPEKASMTYYINNDSAGYKIEYPFSHIKNITLESGDQTPNANGTPPRPGGLIVELNRPPLFYMDSSNSGGFYQCGDFTEDQQASQILVHHLGGHPKVLSVQLAKLVSLESFQNRLAFNRYPMSAPMSSPVIHRPASQPNHVAQNFMGMYPENHFPMHLQAGRGHKRQRSRSVPVAIDFSAMQNPMPSFHMQQPTTQFTSDPSIFAPIPQSAQPLAPNLRIDTSGAYGMDFRSYPMSATTTASTSDFASPSFFAPGPTSEPMSLVTNMGPQYNLGFMSPSPMVDHSKMMMQTASPVSTVGPADPLIADQSPPLSTIHHGPTPDMLALGSEHPSTFSDDGTMLSEMYSKQNLNLGLSSPGGLDGSGFDFAMQGMQSQHPNSNQTDFNGLISFDTVDPR
ncbi:transcriptional regulator family: Homeodomain [Paecilomyces variotii]|nr:transcriptional regulator family: Homeodomain [Paecilomyces variotii]